jgi:hypothetical protein
MKSALTKVFSEFLEDSMRFIFLAALVLFVQSASATVFFEDYKCKSKDKKIEMKMIYSVGLDLHRLTVFAVGMDDLFDVQTLQFEAVTAPAGQIGFAAPGNDENRMVLNVPSGFGASSAKRPKKFQVKAYGTDLDCKRD